MPELKVMRVLVDESGQETGETIPYATKIAVVIDEEAETSEVIRVDTVRLVGITVSLIGGVFQANFVIGGFDSAGGFRISPAQLPAIFTINRIQDVRWWNGAIEGRTVYDFDEILRWVHLSGAVERAGDAIWEIPDLVDYYEGEPKKAQPEPPPLPTEQIPGTMPPPFPFPTIGLSEMPSSPPPPSPPEILP